MNKFAYSLLRGASAGAVLLGASLIAPSIAFAQTPPAPRAAPPAATTQVDELVVVGSRIRRDNFTTTAPIQVINREESTLAGLASTTESLQSTSVTAGGAQINNAFGGFVTQGGPGANTLGLRGLGATRTLILLNGRRVAPAGTRGGIGAADLNVLPTAITDRLEILKDGASSIYGSDAVAGVVNIITRRGINGVTLEGTARATHDGGGESGQISIVGGVTHDRWELSGSAEYYTRQALRQGDRDWLNCQVDFRFSPVTGARLDFIDPRTGQPKCWGLTGANSNGVTINTLGTPTVSAIGAAGGPTPGALGGYNRLRPNAAVTTGLAGYEGVGGGGSNINVRDTFDPRMLNRSLISPTDNYNIFVQGSFDLLPNVELYTEVLASRRESQQVNYRQLSLDYPLGSPLIPANLTFAGSFLPAGGTLLFPGAVGVRAFIGFGNDTSSQTVNYYRGTVGARGDLFLRGWKYDAYASFARSDADYTFQSFITSRTGQSVTAAVANAGVPAALVRNGLTCAINNTAPATGCVLAPTVTPALLGGTLPADWVNYIFRPVTGNSTFNEVITAAQIDGPLFRVPDGEVRSAFGLEYRRSVINDTPPIESQNGDLLNLTSAVLTRGSDSVWEVYGELEVPIFANRQFARDLRLNVSGRYTNYKSYGAETTYRAGLVYSPNSWLTTRASYGTSYRAPALFEQFQGASTGFLGQANDPCNEYGANQTPGTQVYLNCTTELNNPLFRQNQGIIVVTAGGAGARLFAETSTNLNYGVILQPRLPTWAGSISLALDYYRIQIDNGVQQIGATNLLNLCYNDPLFRAAGTYCDLITRNPANGQLSVLNSFTNVSTEITEGLDFNMRYVRDIGGGVLRVNGQISYYISQRSKLLPTSNFGEFNGDLSTPQWTGALDATYTYRDWKFRYGLDWTGPMDSYRRFFGSFANFANTGVVLNTPNYFLNHVSVQYKRPNWQMTVGVRNLFNEEPPSVSCCSNFNRVGNTPLYSGFDYVGRTYFVNLSRDF